MSSVCSVVSSAEVVSDCKDLNCHKEHKESQERFRFRVFHVFRGFNGKTTCKTPKLQFTELTPVTPMVDSTDQTRYRLILIRSFSDEKTLGEIMQDIRSDDSTKAHNAWMAVQYVNNPMLIPALAELLYLPEEARQFFAGDVVRSTRPLQAAMRISEIIQKCPEFFPQMKQGIGGSWGSDEEFRATMRKWWEQNRDAFARKDYAAVKPLQSTATPTPPAGTNQAPPAVPPAPTNGVAPLVKQKPPASVQPQSSSSTLSLFIGTGTAVMVAIVAVAIFKLRGKGKTTV